MLTFGADAIPTSPHSRVRELRRLRQDNCQDTELGRECWLLVRVLRWVAHSLMKREANYTLGYVLMVIVAILRIGKMEYGPPDTDEDNNMPD